MKIEFIYHWTLFNRAIVAFFPVVITLLWRYMYGKPLKVRTYLIFFLFPIVPITAIALTIIVNVVVNLYDLIEICSEKLGAS